MDNFVIVDGTDGMKLKYKYGDDLKIHQDLTKYSFKPTKIKILNHSYLLLHPDVVETIIERFIYYLNKYESIEEINKINHSEYIHILKTEIWDMITGQPFLVLRGRQLKYFFSVDGYLPSYDSIGYDTIRDIGTDHDFAKIKFYVIDSESRNIIIKIKFDIEYNLICNDGDYNVENVSLKYNQTKKDIFYHQVLSNIFKYVKLEINENFDQQDIDVIVSKICQVFQNDLLYSLKTEKCKNQLNKMLTEKSSYQ